MVLAIESMLVRELHMRFGWGRKAVRMLLGNEVRYDFQVADLAELRAGCGNVILA